MTPFGRLNLSLTHDGLLFGSTDCCCLARICSRDCALASGLWPVTPIPAPYHVRGLTGPDQP